MDWKILVTNLAMFSFPISHLIQIHKVVNSKKAGEDLSVGTFLLFIISNMAAFLYTMKGFILPNIMNFIVPSLLEILLVYYILKRDRNETLESYIYSVLSIAIIVLGIVSYAYKFTHIIKHAGIIPSIVLPLSIALELYTIYQNPHPGNTDKLTVISWVLIWLGFIGCYILVGRYKSPESIMSFLVPSILTAWAVAKLSHQYYQNHLNKKGES